MTKLDDLADAIYTNAAAKLEAHTARVNRIKAQINALAEKKVARTHESVRLTYWGEVEFLWHQWIDTKIEALNIELARELAKRPQVIQQAKKGFGRMQSLKNFSRKKIAQEEILLSRRKSYES